MPNRAVAARTASADICTSARCAGAAGMEQAPAPGPGRQRGLVANEAVPLLAISGLLPHQSILTYHNHDNYISTTVASI